MRRRSTVGVCQWWESARLLDRDATGCVARDVRVSREIVEAVVKAGSVKETWRT